MKRIVTILTVITLTLGVLVLGGCNKEKSSGGAIAGAGSSFIYPLFSQWATDYNSQKGVQINYQSIGSSGGIAQLQAGTVLFACTDKPQSSSVLTQNNWVQFPAAIGGIVMITNISGVNSLTLSGPVLANIYLGKITYWDDPAIKALNPQVTLPHAQIVVVRRADGSGTTYNFTNYLAAVSPTWKSTVGADSTVQWPGNSIGAQGSSGVASQVKTLPNSIGYVEYSYAVQNNLTMVNMVNSSGNLVKPELTTFTSAAQSAQYSASNGFATLLVNMPGKNSWPMVATTFVDIPKSVLSGPQGETLKAFFTWALTETSTTTTNLSYVPFPSSLVSQIQASW